jgi:hypothetical protein
VDSVTLPPAILQMARVKVECRPKRERAEDALEDEDVQHRLRGALDATDTCLRCHCPIGKLALGPPDEQSRVTDEFRDLVGKPPSERVTLVRHERLVSNRTHRGLVAAL